MISNEYLRGIDFSHHSKAVTHLCHINVLTCLSVHELMSVARVRKFLGCNGNNAASKSDNCFTIVVAVRQPFQLRQRFFRLVIEQRIYTTSSY